MNFMIEKSCKNAKRFLNSYSMDKKLIELLKTTNTWDGYLEGLRQRDASIFYKTFVEIMDFKHIEDFKDKKGNEFSYFESKVVFMNIDTYKAILGKLSDEEKVELGLENLD